MGILIIALALWFGGPGTAPPMLSINDPFLKVDFSAKPPLQTFKAADGVDLSFREYAAAGKTHKGSAVLVHGSSASSDSMHLMAQALAAAGVHVFALDIRGHGASGTKGHIGYIGQLESDMKSFVDTVKPVHPSTLIGFSSGGGFVLATCNLRLTITCCCRLFWGRMHRITGPVAAAGYLSACRVLWL